MTTDTKFRFTEARIRGLPAPLMGRKSYYDINVPDLELRVTPTGTKSFYVYLWSSVLSRPVRAFLGKWPALTVEDARKHAPKKIAEILDGKDPSMQKRLVREEATLGTATQSYLATLRLADRKTTTLKLYEYLNDRFLSSWDTCKLSSISSDDILSLRKRVRDQNGLLATPRTDTRPEKKDRTVTANRVVRLLSQIFNHAIRSNWSGRNPCSNIKPFPERVTSRRLIDEEIAAFILACEKIASKGDQVGDFLLVCLFSGVRRRNVAAIRWNQINLKQGTWDIPETKNGLPVRIYLGDKLKAILQRRHDKRSFSPFVFPSESRGGFLDDPRKGMARAIKIAEINSEHLTIHTLKHTFLSCAYECGLNPVVVSRLGGHKISGITGRYGHSSDQKIQEAYELVGKYISEADLRVAQLREGASSPEVQSA